MKSYEERVVIEKQELDEKRDKLRAVCFDPENAVYKSLSREDLLLLMEQWIIMNNYSDILGKRIARFVA